METMMFGLFSVTLVISAIGCLGCRKPVSGFICSIAAMVCVCLTGYFWREMLINSGKNPALLGFERYPAALVILVVLFLGALTTLAISIFGIAKLNKRAKESRNLP